MKKSCLPLIILFVLFLLTSCVENEVQEPPEASGDRLERLVSYQYADGGFHFTPDEWMDSSYITYYAREFWKRTDQDWALPQLEARPDGDKYLPSLEKHVEDMFLSSLFLWTKCVKDDLINDESLIHAVMQNEELAAALKFEPNGPFGNFADFKSAVEICEDLGLEYDKGKLCETLLSDIKVRNYDAFSSLYSDLSVIHQLNEKYGFQMDISEAVLSYFPQYEDELKRYHEAGTLPLFMLYEYVSLGEAYKANMCISHEEILQWLDAYKNDRGVYSSMPHQTDYDSSDPGATIMAMELAELCNGSIDEKAVERFFFSCERTNGWYAVCTTDEDSSPERTYYAYQSIRLLDSDKAEECLNLYLSKHGEAEDIFSAVLAQANGIQGENVAAMIDDIADRYENEWHDDASRDALYEIILGLDLLKQSGTHILEDTRDQLLDIAADCGQRERVSCKFLSEFAEELLESPDRPDFQSLSKELTKALSDENRLEMKDILCILTVCQKTDEAHRSIAENETCRYALENFTTGCKNRFGLYNTTADGGQKFEAIYAGLMTEAFLEIK